MKLFLKTLFAIIFQIHSPSTGKVPTFRDLRNNKIPMFGLTARECVELYGIPTMEGLQEGFNKSASGKVDDAAGLVDFETAARNVQKAVETLSGKKEPSYYTSSGYNITALKCPCCGGQIDRKSGKCPFCDTQYKFETESESYAYLYADDELVEKISLGGDKE